MSDILVKEQEDERGEVFWLENVPT